MDSAQAALPTTALDAVTSSLPRMASIRPRGPAGVLAQRGLALVGLLIYPGCSDEGIDCEHEMDGAPGSGAVIVDVGKAGNQPETGATDTADLESDPAVAVRPAAATPGTTTPETPSQAAGMGVDYDSDGEYTVQIGLYNARAAAERVRKLDDLGYPVYAIAISDGGGVRVRIGYFRTRADARRFGEIFKEDTGSDYWIDRRSNEVF